MFIGADPNVGWLKGCVATDKNGFVTTGAENGEHWHAVSVHAVLPLETSHPGVFAIGDIRAGSTKRVAAAVGEGAAVVAQIHRVLEAEQYQPMLDARMHSATFTRPSTGR